MVCPDFDLCQDCEKKDLHPKDHPLLKLKVNARGHGGPHRFGGPRHFGGPFFRGACRGRFGLGPLFRMGRHCQRASQDQPKEQSLQKATFIRDITFPDGESVKPGQDLVKEWEFQNPEGSLKWAEGTKLVFDSGVRALASTQEFAMPCVEAGQKFKVSIPLHVPSEATGKICIKFHFVDAKGNVFGDRCWADLVVKQKEQKEEQKEEQKALNAEEEVPQLKATFLRDLNLPDGEAVEAGKELLKEWEFQNPEGASKWTEGTKLVLEAGHHALLSAQEFAMPCVEPGQKFKLAVPLNIPSDATGKLYVKFQFVDHNGHVFGDRCWADLVVKSKASTEPQKETKEQKEKKEESFGSKALSSLSSFLAWSPKSEDPKQDKPKAEPKPADPKPEVKAEPVKAEPIKAEPIKAEPIKAEPIKAEPIKAEPIKAEVVKVEPKPEVKAAEPKPEAKAAEPKPEEPKKPAPVFSGPYAAQLTKLYDMGFTNSDRNAKLLESARGNLDRVITWLLQLP